MCRFISNNVESAYSRIPAILAWEAGVIHIQEVGLGQVHAVAARAALKLVDYEVKWTPPIATRKIDKVNGRALIMHGGYGGTAVLTRKERAMVTASNIPDIFLPLMQSGRWIGHQPP